ncbi:hypothetical protein FGIG_11452 [Fasciola gigantica]|uniref:Uncharacterized protein n=1 Tax=Fasciola gigantica TaxID=46835 RepID=A0A504YBF0_FASGI|nr:hypothetical protein FGIG_11452 [Fasciola gigantica]
MTITSDAPQACPYRMMRTNRSSPYLPGSHHAVHTLGPSVYYTPANALIRPGSENHVTPTALPLSPATCMFHASATKNDCRCCSGIPFNQERSFISPKQIAIGNGIARTLSPPA